MVKAKKSPESKAKPEAISESQEKAAGKPAENNGDNANGKIRWKSLVIDGTRYKTHLNYKFENRIPYESPNPDKVTSLIPGTIVKIFVKEGQKVKQGDQMLILEAMKMKNIVLFHANGQVKKIYVKEGEKVPKGHIMLEI